MSSKQLHVLAKRLTSNRFPDSNLAQCVELTHNCTYQMASKFVQQFKQGVRL